MKATLWLPCRIGELEKERGVIKAIKAITLQRSCTTKAAASSASNQRKRVRFRRGNGCTFNFAARHVKQVGHWAFGVRIYDHNHELFTDPAVHPQGRALTESNAKKYSKLQLIDRTCPNSGCNAPSWGYKKTKMFTMSSK